MKKINRKAPSIPLRPPFVLYLGLLVSYIVQRYLPIPIMPEFMRPVASIAGTITIVLCLFIMTLAFQKFKQSETNVNTELPAKVLVTDGIFKLTRNPMYLSFCLSGLALAFLLNSVWLIIGTLPFAIYIHHVVIPEEERYMKENFTKNYKEYCKRTARWI